METWGEQDRQPSLGAGQVTFADLSQRGFVTAVRPDHSSGWDLTLLSLVEQVEQPLQLSPAGARVSQASPCQQRLTATSTISSLGTSGCSYHQAARPSLPDLMARAIIWSARSRGMPGGSRSAGARWIRAAMAAVPRWWMAAWMAAICSSAGGSPNSIRQAYRVCAPYRQNASGLRRPTPPPPPPRGSLGARATTARAR